MEYRILGDSGLKVSRLCFGSLTVGPLQAGLDLKEGVSVIRTAFDMGVNFIDTAELYRTYDYIKKAVEGRRKDIIIATKCYAYTREAAEKSLRKAMNELNTDYIDIFSLHEQESELTLKGHHEAIEYFIRAKEKGYIRSFGISTHAIGAVKASLKYKDIEVLHPILNKRGLGIIDGDINEMLEAVAEANKEGKGIYSMKPLGGGNMIKESSQCFDFVLSNDNLHSIAVGMQSNEEVANNVMIFEGKQVPEDIRLKLSGKKRKLLIDYWCSGCGSCSKRCAQSAITVENGKAVVDPSKCVLCGYCSAYCPDFCIKVI
ncbi:MAG: aldo/keto reductase [Clostridiaceae bacterium]|nr:aldo/keto reductase [Clostridiaceae bacterium]